MQANCMRNSGVHSALAPQSIRMHWPAAVGMMGAMAARRMPGIRLTIRVDAARSAPVLPAEIKEALLWIKYSV